MLAQTARELSSDPVVLLQTQLLSSIAILDQIYIKLQVQSSNRLSSITSSVSSSFVDNRPPGLLQSMIQGSSKFLTNAKNLLAKTRQYMQPAPTAPIIQQACDPNTGTCPVFPLPNQAPVRPPPPPPVVPNVQTNQAPVRPPPPPPVVSEPTVPKRQSAQSTPNTQTNQQARYTPFVPGTPIHPGNVGRKLGTALPQPTIPQVSTLPQVSQSPQMGQSNQNIIPLPNRNPFASEDVVMNNAQDYSHDQQIPIYQPIISQASSSNPVPIVPDTNAMQVDQSPRTRRSFSEILTYVGGRAVEILQRIVAPKPPVDVDQALQQNAEIRRRMLIAYNGKRV